MSERLKYALNDVYRCENFAQHLASNDFTRERIRTAGGFRDWTIRFRTDSVNERVVYPYMHSSTLDKELRIKWLFSARKKEGSISFLHTNSAHLKVNYGPYGLEMNILELLNEKNGYLYNGALVIEYGLQVESILGMDKIWRFNTNNPLFDCQEKKNMISFLNASGLTYIHVHKQLLVFHSPHFYQLCKKSKGNAIEDLAWTKYIDDFDLFLQIVNGVHEKIVSEMDPIEVIGLASFYGFSNVILYCQRQLIENDLKLRRMKSWVIYWDGLRHYLVHLLKKVKSPREMIDEDDIGMMKGETMKMFIAKFLYNKF